MCRYMNFTLNGSQYRSHFVCFDCRYSKKEYKLSEHSTLPQPKCSHCKNDMVDMGMDFKPPKKNNKKQWKKVEYLYKEQGVTFEGCGCNGPGYRPKTLGEAKKVSHEPRKWDNLSPPVPLWWKDTRTYR